MEEIKFMKAKLVSADELLKIDITNKIVAFPTDTVYGVGCKVDDIIAIHKIYEIKERDYSKPLAILTGEFDISKYANGLSNYAKELMNKYWPGALTVVINKNNVISDVVTSNLKTVGFRMPNSQVALKILKHFGIMATTSINKSGEKPLNDLNSIINQFGNDIDYIVTDKEVQSNISSTVLDCTSDEIKVLRQGDIKL